MIEIQAKLLRGPVYFVDETIQCLITLKNVPLQPSNNEISVKASSDNIETETNNIDNKSSDGINNSSETIERLCWTNVQLHCFCLVDESQINMEEIIQNNANSLSVTNTTLKTKRSSIALETYASNDTSFHECLLRAEKGIIIYSSKPKILFCDLKLLPYEFQTFVYTETLPSYLNPSYSSPRLKYHYKLTIGAQRIGSAIHLLKIPVRILKVCGFPLDNDGTNGDHKSDSNQSPPINRNDIGEICNLTDASLSLDEETRNSSTPLDLALHRIEYLAGHRTPHSFNITSTFGRVGKFFIFRTVYRLGEDIIGIFNFSEGIVPCVRFSVTLQSEEKINKPYQLNSKSTIPYVSDHARFEECTFNTQHTQMVLTIPFTVTPTFCSDEVSLDWNLHFRFVISQNSEQASPIVYESTDDGIQQVAPRHLNVQEMTWDFPIKIVATHPGHVAKGFQMASIGNLNV